MGFHTALLCQMKKGCKNDRRNQDVKGINLLRFQMKWQTFQIKGRAEKLIWNKTAVQ